MRRVIVFSIVLASVFFLTGCMKNRETEKEFSTQNIQQLESQKEDKLKNNNSQLNTNKIMELKIETTKEGAGERVTKAGDTISVQYTGRLMDGTKFDSSYDRNATPFTFTLGASQVIQGWDQGLVGMKVGEKRTLTIPSNLAYGSRGAGDVIPPNADLRFETELVSIQ